MPSNYQTTLQEAADSWNQFDLPSLQQDFHEQLSNITKTANSCVETRKEMVKKTKRVNELKPILPEDKFTMLTSTIKAYQSYIDDLTRRSAYAENIIKTVSKRIDEVKNPSSFFDESNTMYKSYCELTEKFEHYENENRKLNELKEASENYLKEKQELLKQIHDAQSENTQLKQEKSDLDAQLQQYIAASNAMTKKNSYIQKIEQQNADYLKQIDQYKEELTEINSKYQELKSKENQLMYQNQIDSLNAEIASLQGQIEKEKEEKNKLQSSFEESKSKLLRQIEGDKNTISILNQEIENMNIKYNIDTSEIMDTSKPSTSAISQSEALSNVYSENNALYQDKLQLMDQIEQLKEQLASAQKEYESTIHQLEESKKNDAQMYATKLNEYQKLLSETINKDVYKKLLRCFNLLQKSGINIDFTDDSSFVHTVNYIIENTEKLLLNKIDLLQKHNIELRKKYDELLKLHEKTQTSLALVSDREHDLTLLTTKLENQITEQQQQLQQLQTKQEEDSNENAPSNPFLRRQKSFESMIKDQRDRYKTRVDELELENIKYKQQIQHLLNQVENTSSSLKQRNRKYSHSSDPEMHYTDTTYYTGAYHGKNPLERFFITILEEALSNSRTRSMILFYLLIVHFFIIYLILHMSGSHLN